MNFERKEEAATDVSIPWMTDDNDDNNCWHQHCSFPIPDPDRTHSLLPEPHRPDWRQWEPHSQEVVPLPAACCSLHLVTRPLYLQDAGKMLFPKWHFFLLGCQKQKLFKYQSWNSWIREKQCCVCCWRNAGLTQAGFSERGRETWEHWTSTTLGFIVVTVAAY